METEPGYDDIAALTAATRTAMDIHGWARNECIIACRVNIVNAQRLGWRARPLAVAAFLTKPDAKVASGTNGTGSLQFHATPTSHRDGMFDTTWDGHLLTVVNKRWVADATADQFSRPDHGIVLNEPVVLDVPDKNDLAEGSWFGGADPDSDLMIAYRVVADDMVWTQQYWWDADFWMPVADTAYTLIEHLQE